ARFFTQPGKIPTFLPTRERERAATHARERSFTDPGASARVCRSPATGVMRGPRSAFSLCQTSRVNQFPDFSVRHLAHPTNCQHGVAHGPQGSPHLSIALPSWHDGCTSRRTN